jgi:hypothetical protein
VEDLVINSFQKKFITYNKDSIVVGIGNFDKNLYDEASYREIVLKEVPKFKNTKMAKVKTVIYYYDEVNNYLILLNPNSENELFPLKSFFILVEPFIITTWIKNIENWE